MGSRLPDPTPVPSRVDEAELRRVMAEVQKRDAARRTATPSPVAEPKPTRSNARRPAERGPFERRPMTTSRMRTHAGNGSRGVAWALRTLQRMPEWEMRAEFERDPDAAHELVASLDRLLAALEADAC